MQFRRLGLVDFEPTFESMKAFTAARSADTEDEIWLLQHAPVYTQGLSGKAEHVLDAGNIPVVHIDRGGQVTYHGPGQWVAYVLYDLRRAGMTIRDLVERLERAVINLFGRSWHHRLWRSIGQRGLCGGPEDSCTRFEGESRQELPRFVSQR
jgi:lipoyl(octanoyl) transferase